MNDWLLTLAPIFGLLVNVIVQIGVAHSLGRVGLSIIAGALGGLAATLVAALRASFGFPLERNIPNVTTVILTYLALAFGFWTFLNLNITSLRIRMLREMLSAEDGLSRHELLTRYSAEEFLRRRLERLELGKQMSHVDGRWRLKSHAYLYLARTMRLARAIILPSQREG